MNERSTSIKRRGVPTRVVFLGGVGEIGRNMTVFEHEDEIVVLDAGFAFPTEEMLGVDLVLPDFTYLRERAENVVAILLTHGHEDHVGSLPYLLREVEAPIYGTRLTLGLLRGKLAEHRLDDVSLNEISAGEDVRFGKHFKAHFIAVAHSIPDGVATVLDTPGGRILHTGDFRIDPTPVDDRPTDLPAFRRAGASGIDLLLSDSTNVEASSSRISERDAGEGIAKAVAEAQGRVIVACFASHIHRIQQAVWAAEKAGRFVVFLGRSMLSNVEVARELGYLEVDESRLAMIEDLESYPPSKLVVISTGSQGEPLAALSLMATRQHKGVELTQEDTVIISATPIPGNEAAVRRVIDGLYRIGVDLVHPPNATVHVSGHAASEDLRHVIELVKPRWFIPVHGEYRHLAQHARIAIKAGIPAERTLVVCDGDVVELSGGNLEVAEKVSAGLTYVDGGGVGDITEGALRDRRLLSEDGIIVAVVAVNSQSGELIAGPHLISKGFMDEQDTSGFFQLAEEEIRRSLGELSEDEWGELSVVRQKVRRSLGSLTWEQTKRRPMILPVVMEV